LGTVTACPAILKFVPVFRLQQLIDVTLNFCYNPACDSIIANQENAATLLNPAQ